MSKNLLSKVFPLFLAFILLAGCGANPGGDSSSNNETLVLDGDAAKMAELFGEDYVTERLKWEEKNNPYNIPEELKGTTVEFATWIDHSTDASKYAMDGFEKATGIKVEWIEIPQKGYVEKLASLVASGTAPDVFYDNNNQFPTVLKIAKPLDEVKSINMDDPIWDKDTLKYTTFNGHPYEINTRNSLNAAGDYIVFYNKRTLEENGIKTPAEYIKEGAWTIDAMTTVMREFAALGDSYAGGEFDPQILAASSGSAIIQMKNGKFVSGLNDSNLQDAYKKYLALRDEGLIKANGTSGMVKGTHGIYINTTYGLKTQGTFKGVDGDMLGFAPVPTVDGTTSNFAAAKWNAFGILNNSQNPEGAGYFLRYFLDPYNYNLDDCFISDEARDYYFKTACGTEFSKKVFMYDQSLTPLMGYDSDSNGLRTWDYKLMRTDVSQFATTVATITNEVDTAVKKANDILENLKK